MNSKRITIAACGLFIMLGFIASGFAELKEYKSNKEVKETVAVSEDAAKPPKKDTRYVLKIEDGILVVFNETDMTRPIIVTDVYASTLRHIDRETLSTGVVAVGDFELYSLLEDYSS